MASRSNRKKGGRIGMVASGNPEVLAEAKDADDGVTTGLKKGGKAKKRKSGGMVMGGAKAATRHDRPGRKTGGAVGANRTPMSTAHSSTGGADGSSSPTDTYGGTPK